MKLDLKLDRDIEERGIAGEARTGAPGGAWVR